MPQPAPRMELQLPPGLDMREDTIESAISTPEPAQLSESLRHDHSRLLRRRRQTVGLQMVAAGSMGLIALYQLGIIKHIPEPPGAAFDADKVDASAEAYGRLSVGHAYLGMMSYSMTMTLAAAGAPDRHRRNPWLLLATAAKAIIDAAEAARLTRSQWVRHRAFSFWCLLAAGATFATLATVPQPAKQPRRPTGRRGQPGRSQGDQFNHTNGGENLFVRQDPQVVAGTV